MREEAGCRQSQVIQTLPQNNEPRKLNRNASGEKLIRHCWTLAEKIQNGGPSRENGTGGMAKKTERR
jgi:hypothetical protein